MKNIKRNKIAIIGDPVSHSLSPAMQNAAFRAKKIPLRYSKILLKTKGLSSFFKKLRKGPYAGLNVTVPHKEAVIPFLDKISKEAEQIGAVNTIIVAGEKLVGDNTDGRGYLRSLTQETRFHPRGKKVLILGAGGAARGILAVLCGARAGKITVANRTPARALKLVREFQKKFPAATFKAIPLKEKSLAETFSQTDLLINTTSAGLKGDPLPPLPFDKLPKKAVVSDIVYKPRLTPFLKAAQKEGLKTHGGLGMLLHQGALSFGLWTHQKPPLGAMKKALLKALF